MDKVREEFEDWAKTYGLVLKIVETTGEYWIDDTETAWQAWRAVNARAYGNGYRAGFRAASGEIEQ